MKRGFTLIEAVVVIAILAIILSISVVSLNRSKNKDALSRASTEFAAQLKLAQSYADTGHTLVSTNSKPELGYGVHFELEKNSYFIFANQADPTGIYAWDAGDEKVSELSLPAGIVFGSCVSQNPDPGQACDIVFLGKGKVAVGGDSDASSSLPPFSFSLKDFASQEIKSVIIKRWTGLIYEQD